LWRSPKLRRTGKNSRATLFLWNPWYVNWISNLLLVEGSLWALTPAWSRQIFADRNMFTGQSSLQAWFASHVFFVIYSQQRRFPFSKSTANRNWCLSNFPLTCRTSTGLPSTVAQHLSRCLEKAKELDDSQLIGEACESLARSHQTQGNIPRSIEYLELFAETSRDNGHKVALVDACNCLGIIYNTMVSNDWPRVNERLPACDEIKPVILFPALPWR